MGYHVIDPDDVEPMPNRPSETRSIANATGLENLGLRIYRVNPGERIPVSGLHYHDQQEEVFYVIQGELHVETPDHEYVIDEGSLFVAEPGSPHRAFNPEGATGILRVLAFGAPSVDDGHVYDPDD